jgi:hypothetical protein
MKKKKVSIQINSVSCSQMASLMCGEKSLWGDSKRLPGLSRAFGSMNQTRHTFRFSSVLFSVRDGEWVGEVCIDVFVSFCSSSFYMVDKLWEICVQTKFYLKCTH